MAKAKRKAEKRGRGRPTDYQPEYSEKAERLCRLGATDQDIADYFGKAMSTISLWKLKFPEFSAALKRGKTESDIDIADGLYKRARGYEWDEPQAIKLKEVLYENGKRIKESERVEIVTVHRVVPPDTTACIFWLKNRQPGNWRDKVDAEVTGNLTINISKNPHQSEAA